MNDPVEEGEDPARIDTRQLIFLIERFYDPAETLKAKLNEEHFDTYLDANPMLLRANRDAEAKRVKEEEDKKAAEAKEAARKARIEAGEEEGEEPAEEAPAEEEPAEAVDEAVQLESD
jgi:hypothetical protein